MALRFTKRTVMLQGPIRYSSPTRKETPRTKPPELPVGKVLVVRGRTQTQVYHTWQDCKQLRGFQRIVKLGYALAAGLRPCHVCNRPHQLLLNTPTFEVPA